MGRYTGKSCRLITMMVLTTTFFFVEIVTGYATGSVALVADSFHMLSDIISLIVGFTAIKFSKRKASKNKFGGHRAEALGALVNAVFLMALCFTIVVESVQRFIILEEIDQPMLVLIVGGIGLLINGVGLCLFSSHGLGHGHSHGGLPHGHSHGGLSHGHSHNGTSHGHSHNGTSHGHSVDKKNSKANQHNASKDSTTLGDVNYSKVSQGDTDISHKQPNGFSYAQIEDATPANQNQNSVYTGSHAVPADDVDESAVKLTINEPSGHSHTESTNSSGQLNMRGVFLHILGDFLGSVVVIISGLFIWLGDWPWRFYIDPAMSLIIVIIITTTTIPLFKKSSKMLMNSLPIDIDIEDIEDRLKKKVCGIENIRDFHVWQLAENKIIATGHIRFCSIHNYEQAAKDMKDFFLDEGIHSSSIQPEFSEV